MIPQITDDLLSDVEYQAQPSYTYDMNVVDGKIIGNTTGIRAVEQAVYKILGTERYKTPIYSWNYGVELSDLFGMPSNYCIPEIERRVTEALMMDDRISKVYDFEFSIPKKRIILAKFKVDTTEGTTIVKKEVSI